MLELTNKRMQRVEWFFAHSVAERWTGSAAEKAVSLPCCCFLRGGERMDICGLLNRIFSAKGMPNISTHKASPTTATTTAMAQLPPEDVATMPTQKVVFNAPFDNKATYYMRVINPGTKRIGYAFKTTKPKRINMNPPNGVLGPKESVNVAISCDAFDPGSEDTKGDRVTVEWTNTPDPAATAFKLEWFQGDGMVRRKNLPIEYNV
ncbi:hypothetical protein niasHT_001799 [Heterodera trifolii]|uniref:Major sperm protein n=2 Tax=Heterodera trifolii TaxID=157864 RepID=A0ABD2MBM0_9BILA